MIILTSSLLGFKGLSNTGLFFSVTVLVLVLISLITFIIAWRRSMSLRTALRRSREEALELEDQLNRHDFIFDSFPGMVLVWHEDDVDEKEWGDPKVFGSSTALASVLRFAEAGEGRNLPVRILDGLADYPGQTPKGKTVILRHNIQRLRERGEPFSMVILGPSGRVMEVDGRTAGTQSILWLADATFRGLEEIGQAARLDEIRDMVADNPAVFMDMLNNAPWPAWRMTSSGRLIWANEAYLKSVGIKTLRRALTRQTFLHESMPHLTRQGAA